MTQSQIQIYSDNSCEDIVSTPEDFITQNNTTVILEGENGVQEEVFNFEDIELTDFYTDNLETEKAKEIRKCIDTQRWFYLKNEKNDIISLRKKTVFVRFKNDKKFIGFKFQDCFKEEKNICVLLTQTINEREKMKSIGKLLFYRELYLSTRKNASVQKLFNHYIGGNEVKFSVLEKENVDYYRWSFLIHKNRFNYIVFLIKKINDSLDIKEIKNYEDVYNVVMNSIL